MNWLYAALLILPPGMLMGAAVIRRTGLGPAPHAARRAATALMAACVAMSWAAVGMLVWRGALDQILLATDWPVPLNLGVYYDSLTAVMFALICLIGLVITRYADRYLEGDRTQDRFMSWIMATIGAVLLVVIARNLIMFAAAWLLTSLCLHQLLTHYPQRPWAVWAARKKFVISRLGDLFLFAALVLTYRSFGSFDYAVIFHAAQTVRQAAVTPDWTLSLIGVLYALAAMTKSAQLPFHSWLPDTMETPTPVSALMHAGIINAGGFLIIRLSPLVSLSQAAMNLLLVVGTLTALFGGVVMLTQTSIKRSLAYSTIAQMGFMMLQCGLGVFAAAVLHIVAHSLYKAHAFLRSGGVLESLAGMKTGDVPTLSRARRLIALPGALLSALAVVLAVTWLVGATEPAAASGRLLGIIFVSAVTYLIWQALVTGTWKLAVCSALIAGGVCVAYLEAYQAMAFVLDGSITSPRAEASFGSVLVVALAAAGFLGVLILQLLIQSNVRTPVLDALHVHAANGFYLDIPARRLTARLWGRSDPTP